MECASLLPLSPAAGFSPQHRAREFWLEAPPLPARRNAKSRNFSNQLYFHKHRRIDRISYLFSSTSPDAPKSKIRRLLFSATSRVIPANLFHAVWFATEKALAAGVT
jgi:hypothetical protein